MADYRVRITAGLVACTAELHANRTARAIWNALPIEGRANRWGDELDFEESLRRAPDAALRYKPAGEDYALGGLVVHVSDVMRRYALVLDALQAATGGALSAPEYATPAEDEAVIHSGFDGATRRPVVE